MLVHFFYFKLYVIVLLQMCNDFNMLILTLCVLEVVTPQRPNLILAAHIPHGEADVLVLYSFNIKAWNPAQTQLIAGKYAECVFLLFFTLT